MSKKQKVIFVIITAVAFLLRVIDLDRIPPSLSNDEISIAYDAYSVSLTGRDEHNHFLPLSFQSHNTYKAPLAIYLTIPFVKILGNNEYGARLPSAILGTLTVLILGLLIYQLTKNSALSLLTSAVLAITPWHIYTSRMALESNIALFFVALGVYLFFWGLEQRRWLIFSFTSFALSLYGYHTEWVFTPLLILSLLILNYKKLSLKSTACAITLFFIVISPIAFDYLRNLHQTTRANTEGFIYEESARQVLANPTANIFNKGRLLSLDILNNYAAYLDPAYLFADGLQIPTSATPFKLGLFPIIFLPCLVAGLISLKKYFAKNSSFIYWWALLAPLVPALTRGGVNQVRELVAVLPYGIIIAAGALTLWQLAKVKKFYRAAFIILTAVSLTYSFLLYYVHFPKASGENFQYGYRQIAGYLNAHPGEYQQIVVDPWFGPAHQYQGVPHLYLSYFTKLDPAKFLKERRETTEGLSYDRYQIRYINWNSEKIAPATLYIVPTSNEPNPDKLKLMSKVFQVNLPDERPAFSLYKSYSDQ